MKNQKKAQKRIDRAKRVKEKMASIRLTKVKKDKAQREWEAKVERETNPNPQKQKPYRRDAANPTEAEIVDEKVRRAEIKAKLEKNLVLLQALEDEWKKEQMLKSQVNQELEAQGATDIKSKMDLLQKKMLLEQGGAELNFNVAVDSADLPTRDKNDLSGEVGQPGIVLGSPK